MIYSFLMKQQLTAKLKLIVTPDEFRVLRQTQLAYRDALNFVSQYAFAHGKTSNAIRLQKETYRDIRGQFGIPAQQACNIPRQVGATYKALWTKARKNAEARRLKLTKKRFKGLDQPPKYVSPTLTYSYDRDYSLKESRRVSILTSIGRLILPRKGLLFVCQCCHYTLHADLVGARNISLRTLAIRQDWMATGLLSVAPDVMDDEAKAARLQRYAELRWSPATSPSL
jgi:predicted transposase